MLSTLEAKRGLADGVLDRIGDLKAIKLKRGGQAFLSRLEQMIGSSLPKMKPVLPAPVAQPHDPAEAFVTHAAQALGPQLVACEERFPEGNANPVLVVVVEREAAVWRERLRGILEKLLGNRHPGSGECM